MDDYTEFSVGDKVIVIVPDGDDKYDSELFNAGWCDTMSECDKEHGTVEIVGEISYGRPTYYISFDSGESWWWDPKFMEFATQQPDEISDEDFFSILD